MRKSLLAGLGLATLSLVGCYPWPSVEKAGDLTGDGKTDVMLWMDSDGIHTKARYLFVQKEDGTYERNLEGYPYDLSNFGSKYFFDGEIYREAVSPNSVPEKK